MANSVYPSAKDEILTAGINFESDDIRAVLLDSGYSYSSGHNFLDDVTGSTRVATSNALDSMTVTNGVFDAADEVFSSVSGDQITSLLIYKHTGTESTSPLISFWDTGITGAPVTPNGGNITLQWHASGIFSI